MNEEELKELILEQALEIFRLKTSLIKEINQTAELREIIKQVVEENALSIGG